MKRLLIVTAILEAGAGVVLMIRPSALATLLVGTRLTTMAAVSVARVGAAALLALGVACWQARRDARSVAASGLVAGMLVYNVGVGAVLLAAGIGSASAGIALWPAVVIHAAMAAWCIACLVAQPAQR